MKTKDWILTGIAIAGTLFGVREHSKKMEYKGKYEALKDMSSKTLREASRQSYYNGREREKKYQGNK
jgi:hypothetical protein